VFIIKYVFPRRFLAKQLLKRMQAQAKQEENEVKLLCQEIAKISTYIYKIQMENVEFDKTTHKEQVHGQNSTYSSTEDMTSHILFVNIYSILILVFSTKLYF